MQRTNLNEELFDAIIRMSRLIKREIVSMPHASKFTLLQLEILMYLYKGKKTKSVEIAKYFHVTKSTISNHLEHLEKSKLIKRLQDGQDRRIDWISLTAKGKTLLGKGLKQKQANINNFLTLISDSEKKQLLTIVNNLVKTLENKI
jgi:DNA-binding MarR family transcriptional regulator